MPYDHAKLDIFPQSYSYNYLKYQIPFVQTDGIYYFVKASNIDAMSHTRKGQLTVTKEWAKHLRKYMRRVFWKKERKTGKIEIAKELQNEESNTDATPEEAFIVHWRDKIIGHILIDAVDMWYWDGHWKPNNSAESHTFQELVARFEPRNILSKPAKGTRIMLTKAADKEMHCLVLLLSNDVLSLRICGDRQAEQWLIKNVR